ncbi:MAG: aminopeptidase [Tenericutes bacterium]|nr:aminopeptidase [Mycoplasmatota bacterium]
MEKDILNKKECGWLKINEDEKQSIFNYCNSYIEFLNKCKTEREASNYIVDKLKNNGFIDINTVESVKTGDKLYMQNRNKSVYAAIIGDDLLSGLNIIGSHIDSPRLDLKPNPLYDDAKIGLFKTHYYGGIKKYQWTTIPLALHGVIVKANKEKVSICIGEDDNDPIFTITDILPHLAQNQYEKKIGKAIEGEDLNAVVGSIPNSDNESIKENILSLLNKKYDIKEIDFYSSELELVPAFKARNLGFDESMVAAYGQDDRVCSYDNLMAFINAKNISKTNVAIFADKEEIGSVGNTGMCSETFDLFISELLNKQNINYPNAINKVYCNSKMLSADVGAAVDPNYQDVSEKNNSSYIGYGVELNKYTGARGKSGASDANAEFVADIRNIFESNDIKYQVSELGKVDIGGGGTIAYILANKGIDVIDCGVPIISMHSPFEIASKFDIYEAYLGYKAFFENE